MVLQVPGFYAGIDEQGKLIELGWSKWPTLMHLAWQGQWQHYLQHLYANLSQPALTVPVFVNQVCSPILTSLHCASFCQPGVLTCLDQHSPCQSLSTRCANLRTPALTVPVPVTLVTSTNLHANLLQASSHCAVL